jgi:hypothetical protein
MKNKYIQVLKLYKESVRDGLSIYPGLCSLMNEVDDIKLDFKEKIKGTKRLYNGYLFPRFEPKRRIQLLEQIIKSYETRQTCKANYRPV